LSHQLSGKSGHTMFYHSDLLVLLTNSCPLSFCLPRPMAISTPTCPPSLSLDSYRHSQHPLLHHGLLLSLSKDYLLLSWIIHFHFTEDRSNHSAESSRAWKSPPLSITLFNKHLPFILSGLCWSLYPDGLGSSRDIKTNCGILHLLLDVFLGCICLSYRQHMDFGRVRCKTKGHLANAVLGF